MIKRCIVAVLLACLAPAVFCAEEEEPVNRSLQEQGVAVQTMCTNCNSADLDLGGLGNEHIAIVCDGLPVPSGLAQIYLFSICPQDLIENVQVDRGAASASQEGWAVGGRVEIDRRKPADDLGFSVSLDTGTFGRYGAAADISGSVGDFGGSVAATWARSDSVDPNGDGNPNEPSYERTTFEGKGRLRLGNRQELTFGGSYYDEKQEQGRASFDFRNSTPSLSGWGEVVYNLENVDFDRKQFDAHYEAFLRNGDRLSGGLLWSERTQAIEETLRGPDSMYMPTYFIDERISHALAAWTGARGSRTMLRAGVAIKEGKYEIVDVRFNLIRRGLPPEEAMVSPVTENADSLAAWAEVSLDLGSSLQLDAGLRWQDYRYRDEEWREPWLAEDLPEGNRLLPRARLMYKPTDDWRLEFSAGSGYRQPEPTYEEVCCGRRYRGNRGIRMERSLSLGMEAIYQPSAKTRVGSFLFFTDFDDLVSKMGTLSFRQQVTYQNVNVPRARIANIGLEARFEPTENVRLSASLSFLDADNRTPGGEIPAVVDRADVPETIRFHLKGLPYVSESSGSLGVALSPPGTGFDLSLSALYTGSMWSQRYDALTYDPVNSMDTIEFIRTEPFWLFNVALTTELGKGIGLRMGVDNLGDYIQADLDDGFTDYTWGPLRGRYYWMGLTYGLE